LRGREGIPSVNNEKAKRLPGNLMFQIIETVSRCSDEFDDNVQLQVIKVLLVAVTSEYCNIHEGGLLLAIRACFHVNLITKNQVNKTTAKAALTQILSVINQRMEVHDFRLKEQMKERKLVIESDVIMKIEEKSNHADKVETVNGSGSNCARIDEETDSMESRAGR
jgi:Dimerisation and cyclophilin-binding domain of Mon2